MTEKTDNNANYFALDGAMAMMERVNRRLWIVTVILLLALLISNAIWLFVKF